MRIIAPRAEAVGGRAHDRDRADHRERPGRARPSVERQVAEVGQHRGHHGGHDQQVDRAERLEEQQTNDEPAVPTPEDLAPRRRLCCGRADGFHHWVHRASA
jgi:hypothetical protein